MTGTMNGDGFAFYRLPHADHYVEIWQEGELLQPSGYAQLGRAEGFVFAPFSVSRECPIVVVRGRREVSGFSGFSGGAGVSGKPGSSGDSGSSGGSGVSGGSGFSGNSGRAYGVDFANFHSRLTAGEFQKIVLARRECVPVNVPCDEERGRELFLSACRCYPRMFIALVSTPLTGTWLTATPELLLEQTAEGCHTVALAGTQHVGCGEWDEKQVAWNEKNIMEQRIVATYVTECLERFADDMAVDGPHTVRAGALAHLRTDFRFTLADDSRMGELIAALHPTPAVCGLPKEAARRFILQNESAPRRYYSGFTGPMGMDGETHLYVTLRCMELRADDCMLYAGGGLLPESRLEQEWDETVAKMETMKRLL